MEGSPHNWDDSLPHGHWPSPLRWKLQNECACLHICSDSLHGQALLRLSLLPRRRLDVGMLMSFLHLGVSQLVWVQKEDMEKGQCWGPGQQSYLDASWSTLQNVATYSRILKNPSNERGKIRWLAMTNQQWTGRQRNQNNPMDYINSLSLLTQSLIACDEEGPYSTNNPTMKLLLSVGLWLPCTKYLGLNVKNRRLCGIS